MILLSNDYRAYGEKVYLRFDPQRVSLYRAETGEVLSL